MIIRIEPKSCGRLCAFADGYKTSLVCLVSFNKRNLSVMVVALAKCADAAEMQSAKLPVQSRQLSTRCSSCVVVVDVVRACIRHRTATAQPFDCLNTRARARACGILARTVRINDRMINNQHRADLA